MQKSTAHNGKDQTGDQRPKADVRQEMVRHVDPVIAVQKYKSAGKNKGKGNQSFHLITPSEKVNVCVDSTPQLLKKRTVSAEPTVNAVRR